MLHSIWRTAQVCVNVRVVRVAGELTIHYRRGDLGCSSRRVLRRNRGKEVVRISELAHASGRGGTVRAGHCGLLRRADSPAGKYRSCTASADGVSLLVGEFADNFWLLCVRRFGDRGIHGVGSREKRWRSRAGETGKGPLRSACTEVGQAEWDFVSLAGCGSPSADSAAPVYPGSRRIGALAAALHDRVLYGSCGSLRIYRLARIQVRTPGRGVLGERLEGLDDADPERLYRAAGAGWRIWLLEISESDAEGRAAGKCIGAEECGAYARIED